ncbi:MAG: CRISPR system precrRNA processing endoribonuclease RAMP protein Cas6 [Blastocatellia bacterium]
MLTAHCLEVEAEATTPLALDPHSGSALRGAILSALWERFCMNHEARSCYDCPLSEGCPIGSLVTPLRDEDNSALRSHWRDRARPYIIRPPHGEGNESEAYRYAPGEMLTFGLTLLGSSLKLFPYVIRAFQAMESLGLGRPLPELRGQRGSFRVREVRAFHPFTQERQVLWKGDGAPPQKPRVCITQADITTRAHTLRADGITMEFLSPTRLVRQQQVLRHPDFQTLLLRLAERFEQVLGAYGDHRDHLTDASTPGVGRAWYLQIEAHAQEVRLAHDETRWIGLRSYSARQRQLMPIDGFVGQASFVGDVAAPLRELLVWGEVLHVGKSATKGNGHYILETAKSASSPDVSVTPV